MRTLARGAVAPFLSEKLERVAAAGLELYLYPADLLLRGEPRKVARVRAMFSRTQLDRHAYIVGSPEAQKLQAELSRLEVMLDRDAFPGPVLANRLRQVNTQLMNIELTYADWALLDAMARRFELRLITAGLVPPTEDLAAPDYAAGTSVSTAISQ